MTPDLPYRERVLIGLIALILMAGTIAVGIKYSVGAFADVYTLHAVFDRTGHGLDDSSTVKIRGVSVGRVSSIKLLADGRADVGLRMQHGVRVADTTVASAEPLSVFGPLYVKLEPGSHEGSGPFLPVGGRIAQTTSPTEVTDILARVSPVLQAIDPQELLTVLHTVAAGVDGLGPQIGRTLDNGSKLVDLLQRQSSNTSQFLGDLARLSSVLGPRGPELAGAAQDLNAVLPTVASHPDQIGQLLDAASRLSVDLADLVNGHSGALDQTIAGLVTAVGPIYQQLAALPGFLQALNGFFYALGTALIRVPGPQGHVIGVLEGNEPFGLCVILVGIHC
jgi:phospholipid/cholesterol/gamma-HCH transport system substrate-binding protein